MPHHDLLILGAGSGNTIIGPEHDSWDIAIAEPAEFGGTCMNRGCIPSKMLVHAADISLAARDGHLLGLHTSSNGADWPGIQERIFGRIDAIAHAGLAYRESLDNVTVYRHPASFTGKRTVEIEAKTVTADRIVLSIGARPSAPDIPGLDKVPYRTSDNVMRIKCLPEHLVILGGGFIAAEMAHVFEALGSKVTIIHRGNLLLRGEDEDIRMQLTDIYADRFQLRLRCQVESVDHDGSGFRLHLSDGTDLECDQLLVATGRTPNGDLADVEQAGIEVDDRGYVITDNQMRTTAQGIWALGDVTNPKQLKHTANDEAKVVAQQLSNPESSLEVNRQFVPHAVFGHPQIGSVGSTELELTAAGRPYISAVRHYADTAYGWAMEDRSGFAKVLADPNTRQLLGAHVIGPQAPTLVQQLVQGMVFHLTVDEIADSQLWIHPAMPELLEQVLLEL